MDSKEGIEKVTPVDTQAVGLLDPSFLRPGTHNAAMADLPRERAGSQTGSCVSLDEHNRRESNCLYVRVLRDSDAILEQDRKVPEYCWNAGISKDICEAPDRSGAGHILRGSTERYQIPSVPHTKDDQGYVRL